MTSAVASTLLFGVVVGVTPWAVVIVLVLLEASRGPIVAWSYVLGWAGAIAVIGAAVVFWLGGRLAGGADDDVGTVTLALDLAIGIGLLAYGGLRLVRRPTSGRRPGDDDPPTPRWLGALTEMRPLYAFALGVFWLNYPLVIAWGGDVVRAKLTTATDAVLLCCFVGLGASVVAGLTTYATVAPTHSQPVVVGFRAWMTEHAGGLVTGLSLLVGAALAAKGVVGLA